MFAVKDHRMAGVIAALIADDRVGLFSQEMDNLPFAFIPPLCADDDDRSVGRAEHFG